MKVALLHLILKKSSKDLYVTLLGTALRLSFIKWSLQIIIKFSTFLMGKVSSLTRMVSIESDPFPTLVVLPIQIYHKETTFSLSSPVSFGAEL